MLGEGGDVVSLGASGGHYRPLLYSQIIQNIVLYGMNLVRALAEPRFLWEGGNVIRLEEGYELESLKQYKPVVEKYPSRFGVAQAAFRCKDFILGVADIRGDGASIGL
jgi:gamma-glutamyltranspeptidase/glutathione hydrolase